MSARWIVEEEYIEWPGTEIGQGICFARETRLVNQRGEVVVRRLASHGSTWEAWLVLRDYRCISYRETDAFSDGQEASLSPALRSSLVSNHALFIYDWDFQLLTPSTAIKWRQKRREQVSTYRAFGLYQANYMTVSSYQSESAPQAHVLEWRVYSVSEYLGGYPVYRELLLDNRPVRRHKLLYRRPISDQAASVWMRVPRDIRIRPNSVDWVLLFAGYRVFQFDDMGKKAL